MKTSISLDDKTLRAIDDFRRKQDKIPTLSKAVMSLIKRGLEEKQEIPKEPFTEIPKEALKLENLTIHIRADKKDASIGLPFRIIVDHGFKNTDKINTWILKAV
jgi:hypothetical protein